MTMIMKSKLVRFCAVVPFRFCPSLPLCLPLSVLLFLSFHYVTRNDLECVECCSCRLLLYYIGFIDGVVVVVVVTGNIIAID